MKILMVTPGRLPVPAVSGGAVETLVDLLLEYNERNVKNEISVISVYDSRAREKGRTYHYTEFKYISMGKILSYIIKKHILPYRWMNVLFALKSVHLLKKCKKDFDCIVIQNEFVNGCVMQKFIKGNYIYHAHNDNLVCKRKNEVKFLQSCEKVITISEFLTHQFNKKANFQKAITVYNGVDTELFCKDNHKAARKKLREKYRIEEEEVVIVFSGRLVHEKGIEVLLEAFLMIPDELNAILLIVGASYFENSKENAFTKKLRSLCERKK